MQIKYTWDKTKEAYWWQNFLHDPRIVFNDSVNSQRAFSVHHYDLLYSMILQAVNELSLFIIMFYCIQWFCKKSNELSLFIIMICCSQWFCKQSMSFFCSSLQSIVFNNPESSQELSLFIIMFYSIQWFCKQSMSFLCSSLCSIVFNDSVSSPWAFSVHHYIVLYSMILWAVSELSLFIIMIYCIQWFCKQSMSFVCSPLRSTVFNDSASSQWVFSVHDHVLLYSMIL